MFGRFVCSTGQSYPPQYQTGNGVAGGSSTPGGSEDPCEKGPGWPIIVAFTLVFLLTYPLHMYIAEVYLDTDFTFLLAKYCLGFLYVICIPLITILAQKEIRNGIASVLSSEGSNNANNEENNAPMD